ncbi:DUF968 domain-containing protein [Klebsiella michiganensis]|uniref:DUF968 domain-containing protein n=1 Tax=Klebsiella michiganensis TaxID=1134687 RepID=UPI0015F3F197|nr:DUF968 domain-containing protein [Klebsiella michiganensis]MBA7864019.1 DUF968 domain-containing protein [Klebsiella michiganensis]MBL0774716.1 DUF968 domain-containing protein [Klebsiella michiganensis]
MRALLTPEIVPRLGVVLFKPGRELMSLFTGGRVLIERQPEKMKTLPTGRIADARQPLAEMDILRFFMRDERVINAAGGINALEAWLLRHVRECQYPHSHYHHNELVTMRHPPSAMVVCWHCDNELREQTTEMLSELAYQNLVQWVIERVLISLGYNKERELSIAELCWWAVKSGIADAITETMAQQALRLPEEPFLSVYKDSDIVPSFAAGEILQDLVEGIDLTDASVLIEQPQIESKPILRLGVDPNSPESFMRRPKRRRWTCEVYTRWVKTQPCECCRQPSDDPHHIIGNGLGGTGTKSHDLFVIPLCRVHHDELHANTSEFEKKYGNQLELWARFLDRVMGVGVIVKA